MKPTCTIIFFKHKKNYFLGGTPGKICQKLFRQFQKIKKLNLNDIYFMNYQVLRLFLINP
jgi:hypothetical protein